MERIKCKQLPSSDLLKSFVDSTLSNLKLESAEKALQDWYNWRNKFIENAIKSSKNLEEVDAFINDQLGAKQLWHNFITAQPYYGSITTANFQHPPEDMPGLSSDLKKQLLDALISQGIGSAPFKNNQKKLLLSQTVEVSHLLYKKSQISKEKSSAMFDKLVSVSA